MHCPIETYFIGLLQFLICNTFLQSVLNWRLVGQTKGLQQTTEKIIYPEKIIIMAILMIYNYPSLSVINIFSNGQFYYWRHHLFAATLYLSLSFSLSVSPLSCSLPATFHWLFNPVVPNNHDHWINTFFKELFSFLRVVPIRKQSKMIPDTIDISSKMYRIEQNLQRQKGYS